MTKVTLTEAGTQLDVTAGDVLIVKHGGSAVAKIVGAGAHAFTSASLHPTDIWQVDISQTGKLTLRLQHEPGPT